MLERPGDQAASGHDRPTTEPSMLGKSLVASCAVAAALAAALPTARADTLAGFLSQGKLSGQLRSYYFRRDYSTASTANARAFALAGLFNYRTPGFLGGFSLGASFFTANALGSKSSDPKRLDATLMGTANAINALGQAFVQYSGHGVLVRLGDQLINTPWAGASDSRAVPATYQGAYGAFTPVAGLTLTALRITRFKGRTAEGFFKDNLYYSPTWNGDGSYGGISNLPAGARHAPGTLAFGATYRFSGLKASAWYYRFLGFAHMVYGQLAGTLRAGSAVEPFAGAQIVHEWGRSNRFAQTGTRFFGQPGTAVDSFTLGGIIGAKAYGASLSVSYDQLRREGPGALGAGALISPYTAGYATDPLYTTSMIRGMVELGPGRAWKVRATEGALGKRLLLSASFAEYRSDFEGLNTELYFGVIYEPRGWVKGLTLRNRLGISHGRANPGAGRFLYNRVMITYAF
jgi:hypothetical protein